MRWRRGALLALMLLLYHKGNANSFHSYAAKQCSAAIKYYEHKYNIPANLLQAIALVESGRRDKVTGQFYPWPWAVGVQGKAHYFENKQQAIKFTKEQIKLGKSNIDIGCNQINLYHHGKNFSNIEQAFNPIVNTHYAAKFLKQHFDNTKNWHSAIARYHSLTLHLGEAYKVKVLEKWGRQGSKMLAKNYKTTKADHIYEAKPTVPIKIRSALQVKRSKEGIVIFSRNGVYHKSKQQNKEIVKISNEILKAY